MKKPKRSSRATGHHESCSTASGHGGPASGNSRRDFLRTGATGLAGLTAGAAGLGAPRASASPQHPVAGRYDGNVVLITGATSGIGEATAKAFAAQGARVFFCGRRQELGEQVQQAIRESGGEATYMKTDVREEPQVKAFVQACRETYGPIDIAFNNAGIEGPGGAYDALELEGEMGYYDVIKTNVDGVYYAMRHELPIMQEQQNGVIINTASVLASSGSTSYGAYSASKHAVIGLTRSAAGRHAGEGIRVISLSPGSTRTDLLRRLFGGSLEGAGQGSPMGRIAEPEEIADVVLTLASPRALFVNGDDIKADGASQA